MQVSVILPVHNGERTLEAAVDSILRQSITDFELLIIDDGSTDSSYETMTTYTDPRIRIFRNMHLGLAKCLNYGIRKAVGKYIVRMDADDQSTSNRLAQQHRYLEDHHEIDVLASNVIYKGPEKSEGLRLYVDWQNQLLEHRDIYLNRFVDSPLVHPSVMIRKSSFNKFGFYSEEKGPEDFELWLRWLEKGARFHKLQDKLLFWTDHPDRLTRVHENYHKDRFFELKAMYFSNWFVNNLYKGNRKIWIIGAGRNVFQRTSWLRQAGIKIEGHIDFKNKSSPNRKVISYEQISLLKNPFFLSYVSDRNGRRRIYEFLLASGYQEGRDFYMMS